VSAAAPAAIVSAPQGTAFFGSGKVWSSARREFVSQSHMNFATVLHDYDPTMELTYLPDSIRHENPGQKPFIIVQANGTDKPYIVKYLDAEDLNNPSEILAWLFMGDRRYNDPKEIVGRMEAREKAQQLLKLSQQMEEADDRIDELAFMASGGRQKLHTIRHHGMKIDR
jgi:hypothetical protein